MKSGVWSPIKKYAYALNEEKWAKLNKMEFEKGSERSYEACISQIRRLKTHLKCGPHVLRVIQ
jgi:hypothetical protein